MKKVTIITFILLACFSQACKKFVEIPSPSTNVNAGNVFENDATAASVLTGIYSKMSRAGIGQPGSLTSLSFFAGLSSDEYSLSSMSTNVQYSDYLNNELNTITGSGTEYWPSLYSDIFACNAAISGLENSINLSSAVKKQLLGEAKFMRALLYFYLTNLYGNVPLVLSIDYKSNATLTKASQEEVYKQVKADLIDAQSLMFDMYVAGDAHSPTFERVRPNRWAAKALLARVYLFTKDFTNAAAEATSVIEATQLFNLVPLSDVFTLNNNEAIWQLQPVNAGWNTEEARLFVIPPSGQSELNPVILSGSLLSAFEPNDKRYSDWVGVYTDTSGQYHFPYKYKLFNQGDPVNEYSTVLRLAEQYLIRAECEIALDDIVGGINDLNVLRLRATDLSQAPAEQLAQLPLNLTKEDAFIALYHERQIELFSEWGHRWFDLKRTGLANDVLSSAKGPTWQDTDELYPIPESDIRSNPGLAGQQNPGY